jgi:hypothetical protein
MVAVTSANELNRRCGQNTDLILETGFVEDASAFSYVFCNLRAIRSERECDDNAKLAHTDGSWPVPIGMRQKSGKCLRWSALRGFYYGVRLACDGEELCGGFREHVCGAVLMDDGLGEGEVGLP